MNSIRQWTVDIIFNSSEVTDKIYTPPNIETSGYKHEKQFITFLKQYELSNIAHEISSIKIDFKHSKLVLSLYDNIGEFFTFQTKF
jgi:hypothetical protein